MEQANQPAPEQQQESPGVFTLEGMSKLFGWNNSQEKQTAPTNSMFQELWNSYRPRRVPVPEQAPTGPQDGFDTVFDRLLQTESNKRHTDDSGQLTRNKKSGALGITQVLPTTAAKPGYGVKPLQDQSEGEYIRFGKDLLQAYQKELGGDMRKALAAYNYGIGNVKRLITKHPGNWESQLPTETKKYLEKILDNPEGKKNASKGPVLQKR